MIVSKLRTSYNVINKILLCDTQYYKVFYSCMGEEELGCEPRSSPATSATGVILSTLPGSECKVVKKGNKNRYVSR